MPWSCSVYEATLPLAGGFGNYHIAFDNPAIRRVVLHAVVQSDYLTAMLGDDTAFWHEPMGAFTPGTPLANDAGLSAITAPRDFAVLRRQMTEAGYKGERVALIVPTDFPNLKALADVGADMLRRLGMNVDYQAMDWGTLLTRRAKKEPVDQGGWSLFFTFSAGADMATPAGQLMMRGIGEKAWFGWPADPELERLRDAWFAAPSLADQQQVARELQSRVFETVPSVPLGQYFQLTAYRKTVHGMLDGFATFWNVTLEA